MHQSTLLLVTVTMLMAVVVLLSPMPFAHAVDVQSSVQLGGTAGPTCGLQIVSGSPINYGQLAAPNAISTPDKTLRVQNTGTAPATSLTALGTNWVSQAAPNAAVMDVKTTHVSSTGGLAYSNKIPLGPTAVNILPGGQSLGGGVSLDTFWQVQFLLLPTTPAFTGTASQTVTLATTC
jgi:hypothetical protein